MRFEEKLEAFMNTSWGKGSPSFSESNDLWMQFMRTSRYRFKEIANSIPCSSEPIRILDVGPTPFTLFIKESYPHYLVSTLDLRDRMKDRCDTMGIQFKMCNIDEGHIPFDNDYFDIVLFTEVLEHLLTPPIEILTEIRRIIRPQGFLILSVPNIAALYKRVKLLFGISPLMNPNYQLTKAPHGHLHEYTMKEITSLIKACNFTIRDKKYLRAYSSEKYREGILRLIRPIYDAVELLFPPFRSTIHIECYK